MIKRRISVYQKLHFSRDRKLLQICSGDRKGPRGPRGSLFQGFFSYLTQPDLT
jgi:hypothetical protein